MNVCEETAKEVYTYKETTKNWSYLERFRKACYPIIEV